MDGFYNYNYWENGITEARRLVCDTAFIDEGGSVVPLPEELTKMFKPLECELCGVIVTSEVTAYTHYEGKIHMKNVNAYMKEHYNIFGSMRKTKMEFTPHQCEICKCDLSSLIQAQQHYSGKVHKKNLRKINYDPQTAISLQPVYDNDDLGPDLLKDLPPPPPPPVLSDFICEICNVTTNTEYQLIVHKNGSKHKKKVKKLKESFGESGTDGFGYYIGEMPTDNSSENNLGYSKAEPLVTEYLPLSDEPLNFNTSCSNNMKQYETITSDNNDENNQSGALCIKWYNDKTEAPPSRPLEDAWFKKFNKKMEGEFISKQVFTTQPNQILTEQPNTNDKTVNNTDDNFKETSSSFIRTYEALPEIAKLPHFSVAAVFPQLRKPPSPPATLTENLFDGSDSGTVLIDPALPAVTLSHFEPPKINFREPKLGNNVCATSHSTAPAFTKNPAEEEEIKDLKKHVSGRTLQSAISSVFSNNDLSSDSINSSSLVNADICLERENILSSNKDTLSDDMATNTSCPDILNEKQVNIQSSNSDKLSNLHDKSQLHKNHEKKKGNFVTTNWEISQETNIDNENNQKKKKTVNFLFGFKKELEKKKSVETAKSAEENITLVDFFEKNKQIENHNLTDKISDETKITKKFKDSIISEKIILNSKHDLTEKSVDLKEEILRKCRSNNKNEDSKYNKDETHKTYKKEKNERKTHDHHRDKDRSRKHKDCREYKDSYDRHKDNDEDRKGEKRKHRQSSREEKQKHRNCDKSSKKVSSSQPFLHKTKTKLSVVDYLAPPSHFDSKDIAMYRIPSGLYYCSICDYKSKHSSEFTNHLYSVCHKDKRNKNK